MPAVTNKMTRVRIKVARLLFIPSTPSLPKIAVSPAKNAEPIAKNTQLIFFPYLPPPLKFAILFRSNNGNFFYEEVKMNQINIEIAYALPERYYLKSFQVDEGITVQTAITQSGILSQFPEIDLSTNKIGIFSRPIKLTDVLKEGDRIEIYRPLLADPKEIRRKRAAEQAAAKDKEKGA